MDMVLVILSLTFTYCSLFLWKELILYAEKFNLKTAASYIINLSLIIALLLPKNPLKPLQICIGLFTYLEIIITIFVLLAR